MPRTLICRVPRTLQVIEDLVLNVLLPAGLRVVLTSRPEGVRLKLYDAFVILNLKELNDRQKEDAWKQQLDSNETFEHLQAFYKIRNTHDEIYGQAFPQASQRDEVQVEYPNKLFVQPRGDERDKEMRQRQRDGVRLVATSKSASLPHSTYLKTADEWLQQGVLDALDRAIAQPELGLAKKSEKELREWMAGAAELPSLARPSAASDAKERIGLAVKLVLLFYAVRLEEPELQLARFWHRIMSRTDQIYLAVEDLDVVFRHVLGKLCLEMHAAPTFGPLKDPVRVHEKGINEYARDFDDFDDEVVIAESCVLDIIRARAVCDDGQGLINLLQRLRPELAHAIQIHRDDSGRPAHPQLVPFEGASVSFELIRAKNKFADLEPTHFRNILLNLRMRVALPDGHSRTIFVELQLHHRMILAYNDSSHAHDHYNFFRAMLKDS